MVGTATQIISRTPEEPVVYFPDVYRLPQLIAGAAALTRRESGVTLSLPRVPQPDAVFFQPVYTGADARLYPLQIAAASFCTEDCSAADSRCGSWNAERTWKRQSQREVPVKTQPALKATVVQARQILLATTFCGFCRTALVDAFSDD
ncbi:jg21175 [Pararge aegeria aegeria]|uniref:Jg21175 protein n=1 Tax=Pararge aegeria aegeria TaxID=348720 RepID=A0A8S4SML4_9NEOP|nr:jg21175 [Pararge aegeria aegeria]